MKLLAMSLICAALLTPGCASSQAKPKDTSVNPSKPAGAIAAEKTRQSKEKPPVRIGPDVIVERSVDKVWPFLIKVEDWGGWIPQVTKVEPGAGLSPGAQIKWQWEEKPIESEIITVKENEEFSFKPSASSKKATVKWTLKAMAPKQTLISLRAEVPYGTASETMDKLGAEMTTWITSLQSAVMKTKDDDED